MDALSAPATAGFSGGGSVLLPTSPRASSISLLKPSSVPLPSTTNLSGHTKPQPLHPKSRTKSHLHQSHVPKAQTFVHAPSSDTILHHRAATGYAAALADAACRAGTLAAADVDVRRLVRCVRSVILNPTVKETEKSEMVMKVAHSSSYEKHVVTLVRLLAKKGKLDILEEVMAEFSKICDELSGTKVVVVGPSTSHGDATQFERIAREVQRTSGASRVKVQHVLSI